MYAYVLECVCTLQDINGRRVQRKQRGGRPATAPPPLDAEGLAPSLPVVALRVTALSNALSSLSDTVMDALSAVSDMKKERAHGGVHTSRMAGELTAKIMGSVMRSELKLEERMRRSIAEELSCLETRLSAKVPVNGPHQSRSSGITLTHGGDDGSLAQDVLVEQGRQLRQQEEDHFHAMLAAMDERLLSNDLAIKERFMQMEEKLAGMDRNSRRKFDDIEEQISQTGAAMSSLRIRSEASAAANAATPSPAAPSSSLSAAVRDLATQLHSSRKRLGALESQVVSTSASVVKCEKQERSAVAALEALAADVSSLADETRSIRAWNKHASKLTDERFEELVRAQTTERGSVTDMQEMVRRLLQENAALARRVEMLELKSNR